MMDNEVKKGHTYYQWIFALLANATVFAHGLDVGWISPTTKILQSEGSPTGYSLSHSTIAWIASSMSLAAVFGVSFYSYIADAYGRRISVILIALPEAISWIIKLSYNSTATLIISRVLSGIAAAGCFNAVPMYVKEISQDDIRGVLGTLSMMFQTLGILVMYLIGAYLDYFTVVKVALGLPIVIIFLLIKAPESPAFLMKQGKIDEATKTVAFLRGLDKDNKIVLEVIEKMNNDEAYFKSLPNLTISNILKQKPLRRGFILIMFTMVFRIFNGAYTIVTYASAIMISTGVKFNINPELQTLSFPVVMIIGSLLLACIIERFGRKILLFGSFLISSISMSVIAILMVVQGKGGVPGWLPVVAMVVAVTMWAGISSLPYIILTEMFSFQIRAKIMGIVVTFAWFITFILVIIYTPMVNALGEYSPFIFYAVVNVVGSVFTLKCLPETRGKSEDEILQLLTKTKVNSEEEAFKLLVIKKNVNDT